MSGAADGDAGESAAGAGWPAALTRDTAYLTHPVFHDHRSETAMLRYLRRLADRDFALDRGMIPLGSCTMKLNATTEMQAITWPEFAELHPFAPAEHTEGSRELVRQLSAWLVEITGYDAISLQPNAGSQGEDVYKRQPRRSSTCCKVARVSSASPSARCGARSRGRWPSCRRSVPTRTPAPSTPATSCRPAAPPAGSPDPTLLTPAHRAATGG